VPYPRTRPMGIFSSIWNADNWATQGGRVKTDWRHAPFISTYKNFNIDACRYSTRSSCFSWWDRPAYASLNAKQSMQLKWVHKKYMIYDYCRDSVRFPTPPAECA
jgi:xyloglucan:xyloglucosyl transferase